jgi:hypothetical protein
LGKDFSDAEEEMANDRLNAILFLLEDRIKSPKASEAFAVSHHTSHESCEFSNIDVVVSPH